MSRVTNWLFFILLLSAVFGATTHAATTRTAASCNTGDVQAVVSAAANGDTVLIPAGSCTWTSGVTVHSGVGISIIGTGTPGSGAGTMGAAASCTQTVITDNSSSGVFRFRPNVNSSLSRISCLKIRTDNPTNVSAPLTAAGGCNASTCSQLRIDNVTFDSSLQGMLPDSSSLIITDNLYGVIDHNTVTAGNPNGSLAMIFVAYNNTAWLGVGAWGDKSWSEPTNWGSPNMLILENNSFGAGVVIGENEADAPYGGRGGGRIAVRFNTGTGLMSGVANHGTDSNGRPRGGRQIEAYNNTFQCGNTSAGCQGIVPIRSGVNIVFGNSYSSASGSWWNSVLALAAMRVEVIWGPPWNQCNGTGQWDYNGTPRICIDQPGRSGGTYLSGVTPSPTGWPGQVLDPNYEFNNTKTSGPLGIGNVWSASPGGWFIANQDYYTDNSGGTPHIQTSPTSPFNGTSGVGFGTLANRPTTCTPRVGYWATDQGSWNQSGAGGQGQLYVCTATNTWTLSYTPYTYPHPLISGSAPVQAPNPPINMQVK